MMAPVHRRVCYTCNICDKCGHFGWRLVWSPGLVENVRQCKNCGHTWDAGDCTLELEEE